MNSNIKEKLNQLQVEETVMDQFIQIFELPNEAFNQVYPKMKETIDKALSSQDIQKTILNQIQFMPALDLEREKNGFKELIDEINSDSDLSDNKKELLTSLIEKTSVLALELAQNPRERVEVKIQKINEDAVIPKYAHDSDAGADIYAIEDVTLKPHTTVVVKTGIKVAIPLGYMINIVPRSGLSAKTSLRIANTPGTIDANYRGEIGVIMENTGNLSVTINKGDRIAQMLIMPIPMIKWIESDELDETDRGEGGFGSTDTK